ncbi:glycosyltransferase [Mycobacterium kubicae]|uniref:Glycosyltransferase n=1 Tax=Mycobacterium kubicae TaxID=120959 RepID=A0AAX1JJZ7_9MYCO|nr:glycosyltransferase [Mycobacterium kubicae]MCV7095506.1 glycosyltransferase [Mycobacterium kubicae]ORV94249.1 sugar transferase [Mycobacterium kubicae]QNI14753.1 glycosyltransferase [Mycobacterium kubicae]QPI40673.1 glycosyltransferase [Mycobacterium kubicae]
MSIVSTTYNQEAYVRRTFDGVLAQRTDFPVEFVVSDDASTDATPAIIREYAEQHPQLFKPIFRTENVGYKTNLIGAFAATRGEYIAWCEGDDYWIDPTKLTKQASYLDQHPETAVCFHPVRVSWEGGVAEDYEFPPLDWRFDLSLEWLLRRNFIQNNSVMYRRLARYDDVPAAGACFDYYLHLLHAIHGGIVMLPDTMAVYRRHPEGMFTDAVVDRRKFWLTHAPGHAATFDVMIDLFADDPDREEILGEQVDRILSEIAGIPGPEGRAVLLQTIAEHPKFAMVALRYRCAQPRWRRLKNKLSYEVSGFRARAYVNSGQVIRRIGRGMRREDSYADR